MKRCQRIKGLNLALCSQVATKIITRNGTKRYYCEECAKMMMERAKEKFRVEDI